ncbi:MAG: hypothetical protein WDN28_25750 [Chthoniobacter sp.]
MLRCKWPMKCQRAPPRQQREFSPAASCTRLSPEEPLPRVERLQHRLRRMGLRDGDQLDVLDPPMGPTGGFGDQRPDGREIISDCVH